MLTTVLDLLGLGCIVAAVLVTASLLFGALGLALALAVVAMAALAGSWLIDRSRRS